MQLSGILLLLALTGLVRDEQGGAIAGATVVVRPEAADFLEGFDVVETDAEGRFRVDLDEDAGASAGKLIVGVFADGFVSRQESVEAGASLDVVLSRGGWVEGLVIDARSREPISGAVVEKRFASRAIAPPGLPLLGLARAWTDARGAFRIEGLGPRDVSVSASAPGYGRAEAEIPDDGASVVLALESGVGIYGRVLGPDGAPIPGAYVGAEQKRLRRGPSWFEMNRWTATDAEGRFALLGMERGRHTVVVRHEDEGFLMRTVAIQNEDVVLDDLGLTSRGGLVAYLTGPDGVGVEGALAVRSIDGEPPPMGVRDRVVARSEAGAHGRVELDGLPPGEYAIVVSAAGFAERRLAPTTVSRDQVTELGEVVLGGGLSVSGTVVDVTGAPLPDANVWVWQEQGPQLVAVKNRTNANAKTTSEGAFVMTGLEPGRYRLGASARGYTSPSELEIEAGDADILLELEATGSVTGNVVDGDGLPVLDFEYAIGTAVRGGRTQTELASDPIEGGRFVFEELEPGTYRVGILAEGFKPERVDDVVVTGGTVTDVGTIVLEKGGTIRGVVVDPAGEPVSNAELALSPGHGGRTDADGRFDIRGLEVGVIDVRVTHSDFARKTIPDVELRSEETPVELRIELGRGGAIDGIVRDRDGFGLPGRRLRYRAPGVRYPDDVTTDFDGTFRIERLEEGLYRFELMSADQNLETAVQSVEVEVEPGQVARVELVSREILVSGQVLKNDAAVPGAHLALRPKGGRTGFGYVRGGDVDTSGPLPMNALTGPDGFYELYVEAPGDYEVLLSATDGTSFPRKTLFVPDVTSHTADLRWGTVSLEGRVLSEETGDPVADARVRAYPLTTGPVANPSAYASTDPSGGFRLELEPGEYRLRTAAEGFAPEETPVSLTEHDARAVRVFLEKGALIRGVVVDANGSPPGRYFVHAVLDAGSTLDPPVFSDWADVKVDGSFELRDLSPARYNLLAGTDLLGFAFAPGVTPGEEVTLRLRAAAWVDVTVRREDGAPVAGAQVVVSALQGHKVRGVSGRTDAKGEVALYAPSGALELKSVQGDDLVGAASVTARPGERIRADITLHRAR